MKPYLLILCFFFIIFNIPNRHVESLRAGFVGLVAPSWQWMSRNHTSPLSPSKKAELELQTLRQQVKQLRHLLLHEEKGAQLEQYAAVLSEKAQDPYFARRRRYLVENIEKHMQALSARIIFREPNFWSSALWLNVGERDNRALNHTIIAKNSPVLLGTVVVGVVEQVEESRCLVRLISDPALTPSVRIVRGNEQNRVLAEQIEALIQQLVLREELALSGPLVTQLKQALAQLDYSDSALYLAKGTLCGASHSKWRARTPRLRGIGFNCDFGDEEGKRRHLRTGAFEDGSGATAIVKVGDLLVTTGMDGVFPADLPVATVAEILPLHEGGCAYEIEALSLVPDFDALAELFVLPPLHPVSEKRGSF